MTRSKLALALVAVLTVWGLGVAPAHAADDTWTTANNGLVLLNGSTSSLTLKLRAIECAYGVAGIRQVASEIETKE